MQINIAKKISQTVKVYKIYKNIINLQIVFRYIGKLQNI